MAAEPAAAGPVRGPDPDPDPAQPGWSGPVDAERTVRKWLDTYGRHWGSNPEAEAGLAALGRFCSWVGRSPDALISECLREVDEGSRIRMKVRRAYMARITEFEERPGEGRAAGNSVRSFFIHNGVAFSGRPVW